jgi:hypothetical protein
MLAKPFLSIIRSSNMTQVTDKRAIPRIPSKYRRSKASNAGITESSKNTQKENTRQSMARLTI